MSTFKKTLFLTNKESSNKGMAIITFLKQSKGIFATIKSYNLEKYPNIVLGMKSGDKIIKQNVNLENNIYNFLLSQEINMENNLGCVLLSFDGNNYTPILWGSENCTSYKTQIVESLKENIQKLKTNNNAKNSDTSTNTYDPTKNTHCETKHLKQSKDVADFENKITHSTTNHSMSNNVFDDSSCVSSPILDNQVAFLDDYGECYAPFKHIGSNNSKKSNNSCEIAQVATMSNLFESDTEEIERTIDENLNQHKPQKTEHKFYEMIAEQLDELFEKYPRENNLESLVENSKWVKIKYEDSDKYYVVGIIFVNNEVKYICYGVPGDYYSEPPKELKEYSQWLPTNALSPYTQGFWVMYQDADTGENVIVS